MKRILSAALASILMLSCNSSQKLGDSITKQDSESIESPRKPDSIQTQVAPKVQKQTESNKTKSQFPAHTQELRHLKKDRRTVSMKLKKTTDPQEKQNLQKEFDALTKQIQKIKRSFGRI